MPHIRGSTTPRVKPRRGQQPPLPPAVRMVAQPAPPPAAVLRSWRYMRAKRRSGGVCCPPGVVGSSDDLRGNPVTGADASAASRYGDAPAWLKDIRSCNSPI
jgi:hypothetical protein